MNQPKSSLSILITDDVALNRSNLADLLQSVVPNTHIAHAEDGASAIQLVTDKINQTGKSFDLILMDFKMPGMDGQETTSAIRQLEEQKQAVKSIIITWSSVKQSPYVGANDWLPKPPRLEDVQYMLSTYALLAC